MSKFSPTLLAVFGLSFAITTRASAAIIHYTPAGGDYSVTSTSSSDSHWVKASGSITMIKPVGNDPAFGLQYQGTNLVYVGLWNASVASANKIPGYDNLTSNFVAGDIIDGSDFIRSGASWLKYTTYGEFTPGVAGYLGFSFIGGDNKTHFGWANITMLAGGAGVMVHDWAYESLAETGIAAGALTSVPEPATLAAVLPAGIAGAMLLKRRRRKNV